MREDDDFRHYVPLLRRIIILVAVIIAVPVILWTITVFVRTYVGPPHMPTFHQLASTASINAPLRPFRLGSRGPAVARRDRRFGTDRRGTRNRERCPRRRCAKGIDVG
jgi:hypothetical protein